MRYELVIENEQSLKALHSFLAQYPDVQITQLDPKPWETEAFIASILEAERNADEHPETKMTIAEAMDFARKYALNHARRAD
jgi:hypothetical protein